MDSSNNSNKAVIGIIVIVLLVAAATAVVVIGANNAAKQETSETTASVSPSPSTETTSNSASSEFKDGIYSATGSYQTPGGRESVGVSVTLSNGTITDAAVTQNATGGEAVEFQNKFASGFKTLVVGKKIDEVSLTRVAGSSLTPNGFNNAIADIETQAKA